MHTVCMKCMRWLSAIGLLLAAVVAMASDMPFRVGVAPHTSARLIVQQYQPLRASLEKSLGQGRDRSGQGEKGARQAR